MLLRDYVASLARIVNDISKTNLIVTSNLKTDYRTDKIGIVEGMLTFVDNSEPSSLSMSMCGIGCKNSVIRTTSEQKGGRLVFRYDNARHKPPLAFYRS